MTHDKIITMLQRILNDESATPPNRKFAAEALLRIQQPITFEEREEWNKGGSSSENLQDFVADKRYYRHVVESYGQGPKSRYW